MDLTRAVLLVVDVQRGFVRPASRHVVPVIASLVRRWQAGGGATIFTRFLNHDGSPFERLVRWSEMQDGSPDTEIVPELAGLAAAATAVVNKTMYTSLTSEVLELIRKHRWTDVYVCGIATESCVLKTLVDAFEARLTPWLLEDASASHAGAAEHEAGVLVV